jgi:hypothetical protein
MRAAEGSSRPGGIELDYGTLRECIDGSVCRRPNEPMVFGQQLGINLGPGYPSERSVWSLFLFSAILLSGVMYKVSVQFADEDVD